MSREEAMKELSYIIDEMPSMECADWIEAISMAIEALEHEPCGDAISRQAVLNLAKFDGRDGLGSIIHAFDVEQLSPVKPAEKVGHWIRVDKDKCKCDQCEVISFIAMYPNGDKNYCPNCGAKMGGTQHDD